AANPAANFTGSVFAGTLAAVFFSSLLAALSGAVTLRLKTNVFITGLAVNLFAQGFTVALSRRMFGTRGVVAVRDLTPPAEITLPVIQDIPVLGALLSGHTVFVYASWLCVIAAWIALYKTPFGFRLRAAGSRAEALASLGIRPERYQFTAFVLSGVFCGAGGAILSLNLGVFVPNMSAGRGWIALVIIFLAGRKPHFLVPAAFLAGLAESFSNHAQGIFSVPADFILALPYLFTLAGMIGVSALRSRKDRVL
ncbi:MAG: ABC transporter permease, partial [Spirochaetaceae bacterium]|nr:ABC transporter permease [Spirochaetaceae bacterium]